MFAEEHVVCTEKNWPKVHFSDEIKCNLLGLMGNILFGFKLRKYWSSSVQRSQWKVKEEVSWFGECFLQEAFSLLYSYMAECKCWSEPPLATCSSFPAYIAQSACNSHCRTILPSHSKMGKAVPWSWKHWSNEMAWLESSSKPDWKSLVTKLWLRNTLHSLNCGRKWKKSGPRSHQSSVRD